MLKPGAKLLESLFTSIPQWNVSLLYLFNIYERNLSIQKLGSKTWPCLWYIPYSRLRLIAWPWNQLTIAPVRQNQWGVTKLALNIALRKKRKYSQPIYPCFVAIRILMFLLKVFFPIKNSFTRPRLQQVFSSIQIIMHP